MTYIADPLLGAQLPETPPAQARPASPTCPGRASLRATLVERARALDNAASRALRPAALPALRVMLGVLFLWFGMLKVIGHSPVKALLEQTLPFWDGPTVLLLLGGAEVALGVMLISGILIRLSLLALVAHLAGTLSTFVMAPGLMFSDSNAFLLTTEGEFVAKNGVLLAGALVLLTHSRNPGRGRRPEFP